MTRQRAKELLPVIQAWAEGKKIQVRIKPHLTSTPYKWETVDDNPDSPKDFSNDNWEWRVKPELREYWIVIDLTTNHLYALYACFPTEQMATSYVKDSHIVKPQIIHVEEVEN